MSINESRHSRNPEKKPLIEIRNLTKTYHMGDTEVRAVDGVDLVIDEGEFVAIMGPSGSGKSTLTQILGLLDVPTSGSFKLMGLETSQLSEDELADVRRDKVGFIFQQFHLLPKMSAAENVGLPLLYSKSFDPEERSKALLEQVGLGTRWFHRPNELSGGQQQRVAIARSLVNQPKIVMADEPTGNLDSKSEKEILAILRDLHSSGITVIIVTHEEEIGEKADRVIRMRDGKIISDEKNVHNIDSSGSSTNFSMSRASTDSLTDFSAGTSTGASIGLSADSSFENNPTQISKPKVHANILAELIEHGRQSLRSLAANKVRTSLSILGILIGVASVVAMLALGRGAQIAIEKELSSLGSNLLVLRSGSMRVGGVTMESGSRARLTREDAAAILQRFPSIKSVAPSIAGRAQLTFENGNWNSQVSGVVSTYAQMRNLLPDVGRMFTEEEDRMRTRVAIVGRTVVRELFKGKMPIGEMIKINKINFQVIGVLPEKGANGWRDQDDVVLVPLNTAMYRLLGKNYVDSIDIEVLTAQDIEEVEPGVIELMNKRHRIPASIEEEAFSIRNMADIQKALAQSSQTMTVLLSTIAAISLLVGGIGIMNIMLVTVTERTKEIGLRKAIGAKRRDILLQFLAESVVVSLLGGIAGIILGSLITWALGAAAGWTTSISLNSILVSFLFSTFIGIIFGIYPARKASQLHPIQALRFD